VVGTPNINTLAADFAIDNAQDGHTTIVEVCGHDDRGRLPGCTGSSPNNLTKCVAARPGSASGTSWVEVRVVTQNASGGTLLPSVFARSFMGNAGASLSSGACARAKWISDPGYSDLLGFGVSRCMYEELVNWVGVNNRNFHWSHEFVMRMEPGASPSCSDSPPSGYAAPGAFGWLAGPTGQCTADINGNGQNRTADNDPGNNWDGDCQNVIKAFQLSRESMWIPIFDGVRLRGSGVEYHIDGFFKIVVTGYHRNNAFEAASWMPNTQIPLPFHIPCDSTGNYCISGQIDVGFTSNITPTIVSTSGDVTLIG
jgi:hypothetical protein